MCNLQSFLRTLCVRIVSVASVLTAACVPSSAASFNPTTKEIGPDLTRYTLHVVSTNGTWSAPVHPAWISLSRTSGGWADYVAVAVEPNTTGAPRTGTIVVDGATHTLTQAANGSVTRELWAVGSNTYGKLGDGSSETKFVPVQVQLGVSVASAGASHSLHIKQDGSLWAAGGNFSGQIGGAVAVGSERSTFAQIATDVQSVAAGTSHTLFVKTDGTLSALGQNGSGQLGDGTTSNRSAAVQVATGVLAVSAGGLHTLFLKTDGSLWAMGANSKGQLGDGTTVAKSTPVQIATNVAAFSAGYEHSVFVKTDGTLWGMGSASEGELGDTTPVAFRSIPVQFATGVTAASAGGSHTVFIKTDGTLWGLGSNYNGQLGDGTTTRRVPAVQIATAVRECAATSGTTFFLKEDGTLWGTGNNFGGNFGLGPAGDRTTPVQIAAHVKTMSASSGSLLFITEGDMRAFTANPQIVSFTPNGIWADGTATITGTNFGYVTDVKFAGMSAQSFRVDSPTQITAVAHGFLTSAGAISVTTINGTDISPTDFELYRRPSVSMSGPSSVATGGTLTLTATATGNPAPTLQWQYAGRDIPGATGSTLTLSPAELTDAGYYHVYARNVAGTDFSARTIEVFGLSPIAKEIGAGRSSYRLSVLVNGSWSVASDVPWITPAASSGTGQGTVEFVVAPNTTGTDRTGTISIGGHRQTVTQRGLASGLREAWTMGYNSAGQLGDGTTVDRIYPTQVAAQVQSVAAGWWHSLYVKADGTLWGMGADNYGALGDGRSHYSRPLARQLATNVQRTWASNDFSMHLKTDGTLWNAGDNGNGQLGTGDTNPVLLWRLVASDVKTAALGEYHTVFVKTDGSAWAMGSNITPEGGTTSTHRMPVRVASDVSEVAAGSGFTLYLKTDGTLWASGWNTNGQLGDGTTTYRSAPVQVATGVAAIAAGLGHSLFLKTDGTLWGMGQNGNGQLGDGTTTNRTSPVQVATGVSIISAGGGQSAFVKTDGSCWTMGENTKGQLGDGTLVSRHVPTHVANNIAAVSVSGIRHMLFVATGEIRTTVLPPTITSFTPAALTAGGIVTLTGRDLVHLTSLKLNGVEITNFTVDSPTQVRIIVPSSGITDGPISITTVNGGTTSTQVFSTAPSITTHPASRIAAAGSSTTFSVVATGVPLPTYQWRKDGVPIGGATASSYTLTGLTEGSAGSFDVIVSNASGSVASNAAMLGIGVVPSATLHPSHQAGFTGVAAEFTCGFAGVPTPSIQWQRSADNGASWTNISDGGGFSGSTTPKLMVASLLPELDGTRIRAVGTNTHANAQTTAARIIVFERLTPTSKTLDAHAADYRISVRLGGNWAASSDAAWATVSPASGTDEGNVTIRVEDNPNATSRTASITVNGHVHTLTQRAAGTSHRSLWAMGQNEWGQLGDNTTALRVFPYLASSTGTQAVAAGTRFSLFLRTGGTLWAAGVNDSGQLGDGTFVSRPQPVQITTSVAAIAAGQTHSLILKSDGTLWTAGENSSGQLGDGTTTDRDTPVQVATGVRAIAAGQRHSLFIKTDNSLWAMGRNASGQLGDNSLTTRLSPVPVATDVLAVAAGAEHTVFVKLDGTVWAMGDNDYGQLGDSSTTDRRIPVNTGQTTATAVAAGDFFSLCRLGDGTVRATGRNSAGQLGDGTLNNRSTYATVATEAQAISAGSAFALILKTDGTLWGAGLNDAFQLADGTLSNRRSFQQIAAGVSTMAGGFNHALFVRADGTVWATGQHTAGQVGLAESSQRTPLHIAGDVDRVAAGQLHVLLRKTDGTLWSAGFNGSGQLGDGTTFLRGNPVQVAAGIASITAGVSHSMWARPDGTAWAIGAELGQLGLSTVTFSPDPVMITSGSASASAGGNHSFVLRTDGTLYGIGQNSSGQLGDGTTTRRTALTLIGSNYRAVSAGNAHSLFLRADGTLLASGSNTQGQLGDGTTASKSTPVIIDTGVIAVSAGASHSLYLKADKTAWAMGLNSSGQLGDGTLTRRLLPVQVASDVETIAAGSAHTAFLKSDGSLWTVGNNSRGQLGDGTITNRRSPALVATQVESMAAGGDQTFFIALGDYRPVAPLITTAPASQTVIATQTVTLTLSATGRPTPTYQWRKDGVVLPGATLATLTIADVQASHAGNYDVIVTNGAGAVTSVVATLVVQTPPTALTAPADQTLNTGQGTTLTASSGGSPTPSYQWQYSTDAGSSWRNLSDDAVHSGVTTATLSLSNVPSGIHGYRYRYVATNPAGAATSGAMALTVYSPPSILTNPASQTIVLGQNAQFIAVANGLPTPSLLWQTSSDAGATWTPLSDDLTHSGVTTGTLSVSQPTSALDGRQYRAVATNVAGGTATTAATLTIQVPPAITASPAAATINAGQSTSFTTAASGSPAPTYQWQVSTTSGVTWADVTNSSIYSGANSATLTVTAAPASLNNLRYRAIATNVAGTATSAAATLTVQTTPTISSTLSDQTITAGYGANFAAAATGFPTPSYQWQVSTDGGSTWTNVTNDANYLGATTANLVVANVTSAMNGSRYRYVATNAAGSTISNGFILTVVAALFPNPNGIAVDTAGNVYITDVAAHTVQKMSATGSVVVFAGTTDTPGSGDGTGSAARFREPSGIAIDSSDTLFVADKGNALIRRITSAGVVTTFAGSANAARGNLDGTGTSATFWAPAAVALDSSGNLYVADSQAHTIRKITPVGVVTTLAGAAGVSGSADGTTGARFNSPSGIAVDGTGNVYVADTLNHTIRKITPSGVVSTLTGVVGVVGITDGAQTLALMNETGGALLNQPTSIVLDAAGNLYIADTGNSCIRKLSPTGVVTTIAGLPGISGLRDGSGSNAWFNQPKGLALSSDGTLYVADSGNASVRTLSPSGQTSTPTLQRAETPQPTPPTTPTNPIQQPSPSSGGGGSVDGLVVAALAAAWLCRRRKH